MIAFLILPLTVLGLLLLTVVGIVLAIGGQTRRALKFFSAILIWVGIYAAALVGVGLVSKQSSLAIGEAKCFDEWCVSLDRSEPISTGWILHLTTSNRGRRAQRPDTPRMFLVLDGVSHAIREPRLQDRVEGGGSNSIVLAVTEAPRSATARLLVTEGGFPSVLSVGDENSPFHAKATWTLR